MVGSAKHGMLSKTGLFERRTSIAQDYNEVSRRYRKLVGKSGKAITKIDLAGKAKIKGEIYDVMSINSYIEEGQHVKVVEIRDNTIMVRKWFE
jgi:membrane-bound ClpP family serine protease